MKFGHLFEFHKIPEWYDDYVHYKDLRDQIDQFKRFKKEGLVSPLNGYYTINRNCHFYCIDFIKNFKRHAPKQDPASDSEARSRAASLAVGGIKNKLANPGEIEVDERPLVEEVEASMPHFGGGKIDDMFAHKQSLRLVDSKMQDPEDKIIADAMKRRLEKQGLV